jgi:peptide chain release factor 1
MLDKLTAAESRYEQLMAEMADPAVQADTVKFRTHSKELAEMQPLIEHFREYKDVAAQFAATEELVKDPDMRELAQEELKSLQARRDTLLAELKVLLIPKDPNDAKNVVLEIRAGAGGDEAALFANDLFRMYGRYAERRGWKVDPAIGFTKQQDVVHRVVGPARGSGGVAPAIFERVLHDREGAPAPGRGSAAVAPVYGIADPGVGNPGTP